MTNRWANLLKLFVSTETKISVHFNIRQLNLKRKTKCYKIFSAMLEKWAFSICYIVSSISANLACLIINSYQNKKPLGRQTLLGKVVVLLVKSCAIGSVLLAIVMISLHTLPPVCDTTAKVLCLLSEPGTNILSSIYKLNISFLKQIFIPFTFSFCPFVL